MGGVWRGAGQGERIPGLQNGLGGQEEEVTGNHSQPGMPSYADLSFNTHNSRMRLVLLNSH